MKKLTIEGKEIKPLTTIRHGKPFKYGTVEFGCSIKDNPEIKVGEKLFIEVTEGEGKGKYQGEITESFVDENENWAVKADLYY